ncbi:hypothetical protein FTO68_06185 [Methanocalculus taiwanensis]|uniref:Uncharacterized protein n=1 Tax=Methanocalculus taiwanensis TaxID=106207 RepID=A0ABD4TI01_9EURY|nr:hypothetical protein [Methanocalculus taiwanensis]MCQ1538573.1 hypothetical protein [Methanocalculus taiwanensis]
MVKKDKMVRSLTLTMNAPLNEKYEIIKQDLFEKYGIDSDAQVIKTLIVSYYRDHILTLIHQQCIDYIKQEIMNDYNIDPDRLVIEAKFLPNRVGEIIEPFDDYEEEEHDGEQ